MKIRKEVLLVFFVLIFIFLLSFVLAIAPTWQGSSVNYTIIEDTSYYHNLSLNITGFNNDISFGIDTESNLSWTNASGTYSINKSVVAGWMSIINPSTGNLTINATYNNQTGFFVVPIQATNNSDMEATVTNFEFQINTTNDNPNFTNIFTQYTLTSGTNFINYTNATDEESQYPLDFNISFLSNCSLANWSTRTNCSLLNLTEVTNTSAIINFTPVNNDVGTYYANISIMDAGANYPCPHNFCNNATYRLNKTTYYSTIVAFNVLSDLDINATDCQNRTFQENQSNTCTIVINSVGENDAFNATTNASLKNYNNTIFNSSWFYRNNSLVNASNFSRTVIINVTPGKTEVGNWTINFSVRDMTITDFDYENISVYVNRTYNVLPILSSISDFNTSINLQKIINITVTDDDLLIPDKAQGYNETTTFYLGVFNASNLSQAKILNGFNVTTINMPASGTNRTDASITFTPNATEPGSYFVNLTASDRSGANSSRTFNFTIINNSAPQWNSSINTTIIIYENNLTTLNLSQNVSDLNGDSFNFSYSNSSFFPSFNLNTTTGIINFTPNDSDVGEQIVNITVNDQYLNSTLTFNFTIFNVNDTPYIEIPIQSLSVVNGTVDSNSNINVSEDSNVTINLWIQDEDFKIPSSQKSFYNESLNVNLTLQGINTTLFNFTRDNNFPTTNSNRSLYYAIFIPVKADVGRYNITINVTDNSSRNDSLRFNLTVNETNHNPVLSALANHSLTVNNTLNYRINATDLEDGYSLNSSNFTFNYSFLSGNNFINNNQSIFNKSIGSLNITFNSSSSSLYHLNITVNDSTGYNSSGDFYINVYNYPNINYPATTNVFSLAENTTTNLTFNANHSVGNNLTYLFYINGVYKTNTSSYGNDSNITLSLTPNFTDENYTAGNLTLVVYPSDSNLINASLLNTTRTWNASINHTNQLLSFNGNIGGDSQTISGGSPQTVTLSDYFVDVDASDVHHNQSVGFSYSLINASSSSISVNITNWTNGTTPSIRFTSVSTASSTFSITAYEYNSSNSSQVLANVTSNNFTVSIEISESSSSSSNSGSGGGSSSTVQVPVAFKLISPGKISAFSYQTINVPIKLVNEASYSFYDVNLSVDSFAKGNITDRLKTNLSENYFAVLSPNSTKELNLTIFFDTNEIGDYEVLINATSRSPKYHDFEKIFINLQKINETTLKEYLVFVDEFIVQNPECLELYELVKEAKEYFDKGEYGNARLKSEQAIDACRGYISQVSLPNVRGTSPYPLNTYMVLATILSFILGIFYYIIKRGQISKSVKLFDKK